MGEERQKDALDDCMRRLRKRWLKDLQAKEEALISEAQAEGNDGREALKQLGEGVSNQLYQVFVEGTRKRKL